eukprot:321737_1
MKFSMTIKRFAVAALCLLVLDLAECSRQAKVQKARERKYELDAKTGEEAPVEEIVAGEIASTPYCCSKYMDLVEAVGTCTTETPPPNGCSLLNSGVTKFRANYMLAPFADPPAGISETEFPTLVADTDAYQQYLSVQLSSTVGAGGEVVHMDNRSCVPLSCGCCHTMKVKFFEGPVTLVGAPFLTLPGADLSLCCDTGLPSSFHSPVYIPGEHEAETSSVYHPVTFGQCELIRGSGEVIRPVLTLHYGDMTPADTTDDISRLYAARVYCEKSVCPGN